MNSIVGLLHASRREKAQEFAERKRRGNEEKWDPMKTMRVDNCNYIGTAI